MSSATRLNSTLPSAAIARGGVGLGEDGLFGHAVLHHRDAQRHVDQGRRARRTGNDAALDPDPRGDLRPVEGAIARGAGDGGLEAQIGAAGRLAGHADGEGPAPGRIVTEGQVRCGVGCAASPTACVAAAGCRIAAEQAFDAMVSAAPMPAQPAGRPPQRPESRLRASDCHPCDVPGIHVISSSLSTAAL